MASLTPEQLLAEIEDVIRTMPPRDLIHNDASETLAWIGRATAVMHEWDNIRSTSFNLHIASIHRGTIHDLASGYKGALAMLHQAATELRLNTVGPLSISVEQGGVFDYFDEIRKVIEAAKSDVFFVDPYLDAEFVSRYLPHVTEGAGVRLLGRERMSTLVPAVEMLRQQTGLAIEIRSAGNFHDRFVFIDGQQCYQSGASFKDGARKSPTTLTQITDAFGAVVSTYEQLWSDGEVH